MKKDCCCYRSALGHSQASAHLVEKVAVVFMVICQPPAHVLCDQTTAVPMELDLHFCHRVSSFEAADDGHGCCLTSGISR